MELRVLQYFLAVTREQSISGAAESLHLSQPTLSRQLKEMEDELGKQLLIRGNRKVTLTEEGMLLRKRAEEILELVHKAKNEISASDIEITGDISIGTGETDLVRILIKAAQCVRKSHPMVHLQITSGDKLTVMDQLDHGMLDFGMIFGKFDQSKYEYLQIPGNDSFGVMLRRDDPLSSKETIGLSDLENKPLIVSRQTYNDSTISELLGTANADLNIVATYNLIYNASIMVEEGVGYALCFDKIINVTGESALCFRPLAVKNEIPPYVIWKKYHVLSKAAESFLAALHAEVGRTDFSDTEVGGSEVGGTEAGGIEVGGTD